MSETCDSEPLAWDFLQVTSLVNRQNPEPGMAPTLNQAGQTWISHGFTVHGTDGSARVASETEIAVTVRTNPPGSIENSSTTVVLVSSTSEAHARTSASRDGAAGSPAAPVATSSSRASVSYPSAVQGLLFGRMSQEPSAPTLDEISTLFSRRLRNSGRWTLRGESWTHATSESHSAAVACSLSQILEESVPQRYFLSPRAARGLLKRAERRGKTLPTPLLRALEALATATETSGTATT